MYHHSQLRCTLIGYGSSSNRGGWLAARLAARRTNHIRPFGRGETSSVTLSVEESTVASEIRNTPIRRAALSSLRLMSYIATSGSPSILFCLSPDQSSSRYHHSCPKWIRKFEPQIRGFVSPGGPDRS